MAEAAEILRGAHRQIAAVVRYSLFIERASQMRNRFRGVLAMLEDVVVR